MKVQYTHKHFNQLVKWDFHGNFLQNTNREYFTLPLMVVKF